MTLSSFLSREGSAVNPVSDGGLAAPQSEAIRLMPPDTASGSQGWTADSHLMPCQAGYCML